MHFIYYIIKHDNAAIKQIIVLQWFSIILLGQVNLYEL